MSNESAQDVFFDNLTIQDHRGPLLEETHYYPFGLTMAGISDKALKTTQYPKNKYKFNSGNELQDQEFGDGTGLEIYDATFRMYDPQIGRFWQHDPMADWNEDYSPYSFVNNNPVNFTDPLGLLSDSLHPQQLQTVTVSAKKKDCHSCTPSPASGAAPPPATIPPPINPGRTGNGNPNGTGNANTPATPTHTPAGITFTRDANRQVVSQYTLDLLAEMMRRSGNPNIIITSTQRTPEAQARAMLNNILNHGVQSQLDLYNNAGDHVVRVAAAALHQHQSRDEVLRAMVAEMMRIGPGTVSRHIGDPSVINVLDISANSITNRDDFIREIRANNIHLFSPPADPAFHLEIRQPQH